ncbi:MAG: 4Fe-4S binding protein [Erysipelotrichia bacterium]|jgi:MinD superfamily P-loop ATPase|nr:4Fe-4S binding protein [Erysipelotrichia bacterium]
MKIAVLSGKGGTGKTFVAVNLAAVSFRSTYLDCDVEEPNGHLFFKSSISYSEEVKVKIPYAISSLCDGSRKCVEFCQYNALAYVQEKLIVFEDVCHSCGGCVLVCPNGAIREKDKVIGIIQEGQSNDVRVISGFLNPGEASGIPIIKNILQKILLEDEKVFIDCPPGSSCIVMESIKNADFCLIIAEPTIFGVHNLAMVHELVSVFKKPFAVVLNKCSDEDNPAKTYCLNQKIRIIAEIPYSEEIGNTCSNGLILVRELPKYRPMFQNILAEIEKGNYK